MRQAIVTLPDRLAADLDVWLEGQDAPPTFAAVVQAALAEYLANHRAGWPSQTLRITPAQQGSGLTEVSERHDEYFAIE